MANNNNNPNNNLPVASSANDNHNDAFKLRRFSGKPEDYQSWQRDFTALMRFKGLASILKAENDPIPQDLQKREEYNILNGNLYSYLCLALNDANVRSIEIKARDNGWRAW